jgi:hypothetical protein
MGQARDTADPLGFRAAAVRVARRLVPALTQSSFRARGFSLVCFGLDAGRRPPTLLDRAIDDAFLRFIIQTAGSPTMSATRERSEPTHSSEAHPSWI